MEGKLPPPLLAKIGTTTGLQLRIASFFVRGEKALRHCRGAIKVPPFSCDLIRNYYNLIIIILVIYNVPVRSSIFFVLVPLTFMFDLIPLSIQCCDAQMQFFHIKHRISFFFYLRWRACIYDWFSLMIVFVIFGKSNDEGILLFKTWKIYI